MQQVDLHHAFCVSDQHSSLVVRVFVLSLTACSASTVVITELTDCRRTFHEQTLSVLCVGVATCVTRIVLPALSRATRSPSVPGPTKQSYDGCTVPILTRVPCAGVTARVLYRVMYVFQPALVAVIDLTKRVLTVGTRYKSISQTNRSYQ